MSFGVLGNLNSSVKAHFHVRVLLSFKIEKEDHMLFLSQRDYWITARLFVPNMSNARDKLPLQSHSTSSCRSESQREKNAADS